MPVDLESDQSDTTGVKVMFTLQGIRHRRFRVLRILGLQVGCVLASLVMTLALAHAQGSPYQYAAPPAWLRSDVGGAIILRPPDETNGATLMLLPPVPRQPDFDGQFAALQTGIASGLGLSNMRDAQQQRSANAGGEQRAHFARYTGAGGDRYLAVMARTEGVSVATVAFLATSSEAYKRQLQPAMEVFNGLHLAAPDAAAASPHQGAVAQAPSAARDVPATAATRGTDIAGVWASYRKLGVADRYTWNWLVLFDDGESVMSLPLKGLQGLNRAAEKQLSRAWGTYTWDGQRGAVARPGVNVATRLANGQKAGELLVDDAVYYRCAPVDGLLLDGAWTTYANPSDPQLDAIPYGQRPVLRFLRNGSFRDEGVFAATILKYDDLSVSTAPGDGTYAVRDFSMVLRYRDGRVRQLGLTGFLGLDPRKDADKIFIGRIEFNRRP
jgi:hypothetical protein